MIKRLLVANRAEVASRVFRTCRRLGIETVAVHADADAGLPYVLEADVAVRLPGNAPADTYLRVDLLVEAAERAGADAVHPGYGFLSENAEFARAVEAAGLSWVGPTPESIEVMGSKLEAKRIMREAGVPVLEAPAEPTDADLPLLVKASTGGGGRGMRVVRRLEDLPGEVAIAEAEALSAFGDGTVFVEPYVERGRHVEVQVLGNGQGGVLVLGDRDCSVQRRHQKVLEESPAPGLSVETAEALHDAARRAAEAISYRGAGTVEFLYDPESDRFWFLEMNTRLQVEHPVTEAVWDVDLVELQLAVAESIGVARPAALAPRPPTGHAIEVRLYAEDPGAGYQPQSGVLTRFEIPAGQGIRVDAGYESGSTVSTFYDAMLAKVVCHAPNRAAAARRLADTLARARIHGVTTNRDLVVAVLRSEAFLSGEISTAFLEEHPLVEEGALAPVSKPAAIAAAIALAEHANATRTVQRGVPVAWRNVPSQPQHAEFDDGTVVQWWRGRDGYVVDGVTVVEVRASEPPNHWAVTLEADGVGTTYDVTLAGETVDVDGPVGHARLTRKPRLTDPADAVASGSLLAPMPGTVTGVAVEKGDEVTAGQPVLVLEAMKMQHTVAAPHDGVVAAVDVQPGQQVAAGDVLAVVEQPGG